MRLWDTFNRYTSVADQKRALLARIIFSAPQDIFTVDTQQADKFRQLAGDKNQKPHIQIGGSLKVAPASLPADAALVAMLSEAADTRPILLAASTHKGEDELILAASKQASDSGLAHFLIIAPRHPERGSDIAAKIPNLRPAVCQQGSTCTLNPSRVDSALESAGGLT